MNNQLKKEIGVFSELSKDIPASIVVFLVALPLCLGIAIASGAAPMTGLVAGVSGGIVVGLFSGSSIGVSGPAAGLAAIIAGYLSKYEFDYFLLAVVLSGIIQLTLGFLRAGVIGDYFPSSVIKGMLAAIGILLILKQIPHALGRDVDAMGSLGESGRETSMIGDIIDSLQYPTLGAIIISTISIALIILWKQKEIQQNKILKLIPSPLLVVILGVLINQLYTVVYPEWVLSSEHLVMIPIPENLAGFTAVLELPDFAALQTIDFDGAKELLLMGFTIAIVGSLETLLSVEATDKLDPLKRITPPDRELKAQGIGNIVSGMLGGLPLTQVIVRSTANVTANGRTKLSAILHGVLLLSSILFIPQLLNKIPLASLAAILIMIGYRLASVTLFKKMLSQGVRLSLPFMITIGAILTINLLVGIMVGLVVAIFFIVQNNRKNEPFEVKMKRIHKMNKAGYQVEIIFHEEATYLSKHIVQRSLLDIPPNSEIIVDARESRYLSNDVLEAIRDYKNEVAVNNNISLELKLRTDEFKGLRKKIRAHLKQVA